MEILERGRQPVINEDCGVKIYLQGYGREGEMEGERRRAPESEILSERVIKTHNVRTTGRLTI